MKSLKITLTLKDATILLEKVKDSDFNPSIQKKIQFFVDDTTIFLMIEEFLLKNELSPFWIPPIRKLGKYKNGYALVKKISEMGGLNKIRSDYADYLSERYKKLSDIETPTEEIPVEDTSEEIPVEETSKSLEIVALNKQFHPLFNDD